MKALRHGAAVLLAVVMSTAVAACTEADNTGPYVPQGGLNANNGAVVLDDVWVDDVNGVPSGGSAALRLYVDNESNTDDALVGVSSDTVSKASLRKAGKPVSRIDLPAQQAVDLEWGNGTGVQLEHFRRTIQPGQWFSVTFSFAKSDDITMLVTAGPLGTLPSTTPSQTATAGRS